MKFLLSLLDTFFFFFSRLQTTMVVEFVMYCSVKILVIWYNMKKKQVRKVQYQ